MPGSGIDKKQSDLTDEYVSEKTKLKNTNYGPAVVYQDNEKTIPARVRQQMPTGGDGTAYMGEAAESKSQQRLMGMVYAYLKGEMPDASDEVKKIASGMSLKDAKKFASTKHAKLPEKVEEKLDKKDIPFLKDLAGKLSDGAKKHQKQSEKIKLALNTEDTAIESELTIQDWKVDEIKFTEIEAVDIIKPEPLKPSPSNWREDLGEDWQKVNRKDKTDGLSRKAVKAYRRENPGSKLKTAVTKDPKKLKKGSKSAKRRLSFCRRMKGMKKKLTSAKTRRDPDSRINKALRRWNC